MYTLVPSLQRLPPSACFHTPGRDGFLGNRFTASAEIDGLDIFNSTTSSISGSRKSMRARAPDGALFT
jgi:hypothetical protein